MKLFKKKKNSMIKYLENLSTIKIISLVKNESMYSAKKQNVIKCLFVIQVILHKKLMKINK